MIHLIDQNLEELARQGRVEADETMFTLPDQEEVVLGRFERADGVDFTIRYGRVSKRHCVIRKYQEGFYMVKDLGSTFGTFIDDIRIIHETMLMEGNRLSLGGYEYVINIT